jgi:hypothetical protein
VPVGASGFFFPVSIAAWRYLQLVRPALAGDVHAFWTDHTVPLVNELEVSGMQYLARRGAQSYDYSHGPVFVGPGGTWLMDVLDRPDVMDAIEALAYAIWHAVGRDRIRRGALTLDEIPVPDADLTQRLEAALRSGVAGPEPTSSNAP